MTVLHQPPSTWSFAWGIVGVAGVGLLVIGPDADVDVVGLLAGLGAPGRWRSG